MEKVQTPSTAGESSTISSENVTNGFEALLDKAETEKISGGEEVEFKPEPEKPQKKHKVTAAQRKKQLSIANKRYRDKKKTEAGKEPEVKPFEIINKDVMKVFAGLVPFGILAIALNDNKYRCTDQEKEVLAVQWDNLLNSRLPDIFESYGPECALGLTISMFSCLLSAAHSVKKNCPRDSKRRFENGLHYR